MLAEGAHSGPGVVGDDAGIQRLGSCRSDALFRFMDREAVVCDHSAHACGRLRHPRGLCTPRGQVRVLRSEAVEATAINPIQSCTAPHRVDRFMKHVSAALPEPCHARAPRPLSYGV